MAVFTPVSPHDARSLLASYKLGELRTLEGIASGIENSNFFVDTTQGRFVLTLFERLDATQLPFYLGLMRHLASRGIPCPNPIANRHGELFSLVKAKPAALVTRLQGTSIEAPSVTHCEQVGAVLAAMHSSAEDYPGQLPNPRGRQWWEATAPKVRPFLDERQRTLLDDEMRAQRAFAASPGFARLPAGAVHADLFRDNVLFIDRGEAAGQLGGVIDFYFAGRDAWLYDLCVTVNDWCIDPSGQFDPQRLNALLRRYLSRRPLESAEREAWPLMLRAAALRFWLSRLFDLHCPRPAQMVSPKDPGHFEQLLRVRRENPPPSEGQ